MIFPPVALSDAAADSSAGNRVGSGILIRENSVGKRARRLAMIYLLG